MVDRDSVSHAAVDFLRSFAPDTSWCLAACTPERDKIDVRSFSAATADLAEQWLSAYSGQRNCYFTVGVARDPNARKKPKLTEISRVTHLHVDLDPRAGEASDAAFRARVLRLLTTERPSDIPEPTILINSGGGFGVFWRLATPVELSGDRAEAEALGEHNRWLAERLGGDPGTHNADRLMRLPGLPNLPGEAKRKKGRVQCDATLVWHRPELYYPLSTFPAATTKKQEQPHLGLEPRAADAPLIVELDELTTRYQVPERVRMLIHRGKAAYTHEMYSGKKPRDPNDGSAALYDAIANLIRHGVPDNVIQALILDQTRGISQEVYFHKSGAEKEPNPQGYARKQIEKAHSKATTGEAHEKKAEPTSQPVAATQFARDQDGKICKTMDNVMAGITMLGGKPCFDVLSARTRIVGFPQEDLDSAVRHAKVELELQYRFRAPRDMVVDALTHMAAANQVNPVTDYLSSLKWDGEHRLESMLNRLFGAACSTVNAAVGAKWMLSAVARAMNPGCKADYMLILEGPQGMKKSMALEALFGATWTNTSFAPIDSKDGLSALRGKWLRVFEECDSLSKKDAPLVKAFISATLDTYRPSYAREEHDFPRRCVFAGTTNQRCYLVDSTGARRFWTVAITAIDIDAIRSMRDQLWAEAVHRYHAGEHWWIEDAETEAQLKEAQGERHVVNDMPLRERVEMMLEGQQGSLRLVTIIDTLRRIGVPVSESSERSMQTLLGPMLRSLGWEPKEKPRRYVKGAGEELGIAELLHPSQDVRAARYDGVDRFMMRAN